MLPNPTQTRTTSYAVRGNTRGRYHTALGRMREVVPASSSVKEVEVLLDRVCAMPYRLAHGQA